MSKKKKKKKHPHGPRRKRMKRTSRLQSARGWMQTYDGRDLVRGYSRWYGVDRLTAVLELRQLGVPDLEEREAKERRTVELKTLQNARRKESRRQQEAREECLFSDSDDTFAYIAGYTPGGTPYGITWEEWGEPEEGNEQPVRNQSCSQKEILDDDWDLPF
jgi:hypothetical protein